MAVARGQAGRSGGVARAAGRLILLVALGFGAGLVIGVVSEEPELLVGHLRGESESVPLLVETDAADVASTGKGGEAAASAQQPSGPLATAEARAAREHPAEGDPATARRVAMQAAPVAADASILPEVAAAPSPQPVRSPVPSRAPVAEASRSAFSPAERAWAIQVGAFANEAVAEQLASGLVAKGYPVDLVPATGKTRSWRVRIQPLSDEASAREMADRLKRDERLPTWVLPMEARSR